MGILEIRGQMIYDEEKQLQKEREKGRILGMDCKIVTIPGDGIGPEIVREACKILDKVGQVYGHTFEYNEILMGGCQKKRRRAAGSGGRRCGQFQVV